MEYTNITEVCDIEIGKTPSRSNNDFWGRGYKWVSIADINSKYIFSTKEEITEDAIQKTGIKLVPANTVIMSFKLSVGKVAITGCELYTNEAIAAFHVKDTKVLDFNYLYYALQTLNLTENTDRAVMGLTLNKGKLQKLSIPLPSIQTQKKIVEVLDKAQALIDKRKEQIKLLDDLIQSIFYDMFGDPVTNPKGWELRKIGDIYEVKTGGTPSRKNKMFWENVSIPWLKTNEVVFTTIYNTEEKINPLALEKTNVTLLPVDTIVIAMYGQGKTRGRVAKLGIEATTNQACAALLPISKVNVDFMFNYLRISYEELRELGRGGNQPNLNLNLVREFNFIIPPLSMQNQFAEKVQKIESQKQLMEKSLEEMENNYSSLMQRAFKGELFS